MDHVSLFIKQSDMVFSLNGKFLFSLTLRQLKNIHSLTILIRPACHVTEKKTIPCMNISMLHHIDIHTFLFIKEQVIISMYCGASLRPVSLNLLLP